MDTDTMIPEALNLVCEILRGAPSLPGALCPDWALTFEATTTTDAETRDYAVPTAVRLCRSCPALSACQAWLEGLPAEDRPPGVIAGRINTPS